jgi:hypothetical protein
MRERLKSLQRLHSVQKDMHRLAEWRFAKLERQLHLLGEEQKRLLSYLDGDSLLSLAYTHQILERLRALEAAKVRFTRDLDTQRAAMLEDARKMGQIANAVEVAADDRRREDEKRELAEVIEAALNRTDASFR